MQRLEVSGAVGLIYGSLGVKRLKYITERLSDYRRPQVYFLYKQQAR